MKIVNIPVAAMIVSSCFFLEALGGKEGTVKMAKKQQQGPVTSEVNMEDTYVAIQQGKYADAYTSFISGVDKNDATLGGFIFETIINGLIIFGHLKPLKIEDYGISAASINALKSIPESDVISVFQALYDIAHNRKKFSGKSIPECFRLIKAQKD